MFAINTNRVKSPEKSITILVPVAPIAFRIPTSLLLCTVMNDAKPNKPIQAILMARSVK
ncbi:hypothetical protein ES708_08431 [subsurface metagenome]